MIQHQFILQCEVKADWILRIVKGPRLARAFEDYSGSLIVYPIGKQPKIILREPAR